MNKEKFEIAKNKILNTPRERKGIGTLSEKTIHAVLKNYYEEDPLKHEVKIEKMVADIFDGKEIIEIQTGSFQVMRKKLTCFLPLYPVTIVYPVPREKWVYWIDEETGEFSQGRKSPLKGNAFFIFKELYKIKSFLKDENLRFRIVLMDMEEYRLLNGWSKDKKRGSHRFDRIPKELVEEIEIDSVKDYMQLVPYHLQEPFMAKEFGKAVHIKKELAGVTLNILFDLGIVNRVGKKGNSYLYEVAEMD